MTVINPDARIGTLATQHPELLDLFDRLGVDYCCHGGHTVADACARAGVPLQRLQTEAARAPGPAQPDALTPGTMSALCDEIERTHHALVRSTFSRLATLMPRILQAHAPTHPWLYRLADVLKALELDMNDHMVREERVLFPWLRRLENPGSVTIGPPWSVRRPIDCMVHDHDDASRTLDEIRSLTSGFTVPEGTCASMAALMNLLRTFDLDMHRHVHKENNILFPAGIKAEEDRQSQCGSACGC